MGYIIGIVLAIIALLIMGLILRKRVYDHVDKIETWKLDIKDRDVAGELSRIKNLNLSGETQVKFESWKERWDHIVGKELADIEKHLLEAESAADRFRISKGKKILKQAELDLQSIEKSIDHILSELHDLLESAKTSSVEVETIEPMIKELRKTISQSRYQYGKADVYYENELDKVREYLEVYYEEVDSGNYIEAKQQVIRMKEELSELEEEISTFPEIYRKARHELSSQLDNLLSGLKEMRSDGYYIEHLSFDGELRTFQEKLTVMIQLLEEGNLLQGTEMLNEIDLRISQMYELLENEAIAKSYLDRNVPIYQEAVATLDFVYESTKKEVSELRKAYYVEDAELEKFLADGKRVEQLKKELNAVLNDVETNSAAHTELRTIVEDGLRQVEELEEKQKEFQEKIHTLRKDELEAREKLASMHDKIAHLHRKLRRSNIPGVPTYVWTSLEETQEKNNKVLQELEQHPLDTNALHATLEDAELALREAQEKIDIMLDQAYLTEQVIQYANRYRSRYPMLAAELAESERLFRSCEYELSLEKAAKAVEEIEPGALKRIEENQVSVYN